MVHEPEAAVLRRIFREMAAGTSAGQMIRKLDADGIPNPTGLMRWNKKSIAHFLQSELYEPRPADEVARMVSSELAATLDGERVYGLWIWNRRKMTTRKEWDGKEYVARYSTTENPPEQWLRVPVDITGAGWDRSRIERARELAKDRYIKPSKAAGRFWQLRGVARCGECGAVLSPQAIGRKRADGSRPKTLYYQCRRRFNTGPRDCDHTRSYPAAALEQEIWEAVYGLLSEPERLLRQYREHIDRQRRELCWDPAREARHLTEELRKLEQREDYLLDLAADTTMPKERLRAKLDELDRQRQGLQKAIREVEARRQAIREPEADYRRLADLLAAFDAARLASATPEERHALYVALGLKAKVDREGNRELSGTFYPEMDPPVYLPDLLIDPRRPEQPGGRIAPLKRLQPETTEQSKRRAVVGLGDTQTAVSRRKPSPCGRR